MGRVLLGQQHRAQNCHRHDGRDHQNQRDHPAPAAPAARQSGAATGDQLWSGRGDQLGFRIGQRVEDLGLAVEAGRRGEQPRGNRRIGGRVGGFKYRWFKYLRGHRVGVGLIGVQVEVRGRSFLWP